MKTIERIPFLSNVLIVACTRMNNSDLGKLIKAVVTYATDGTHPAMVDLRLETYFDLIVQDLDSLRTAADQKSRKCSESAKCRTAKSTVRPANAMKKTNDDTSPLVANDKEEKSDSDFNANESTSSFEQLKQVYGKTGNNESQAFDVWKQLTADERTLAFAHAQRLQSDLTSRSYLFVYLRDKEWRRTGMPQGGLQ